MSEVSRWFWVGSRAEVLAAAQRLLGRAPSDVPLCEVGRGDIVLVDARAGDAASVLPHGHVFSGVRVLKAKKGVRVYVVVDHDDPVGAQLARFCLADGSLIYDVDQGSLDGAGLLAGRVERQRPSVDQLLQRIEGELAARGGGESTLQRLLRFESDVSLLTRLQDPETGLLDGPYATLKLDEEWKRAIRFHQPLSLLLLDVGRGLEDAGADERRAALAEVAGVFLNECRDIDVLARFAPTVFLFLLPGTGPDGAEVLARRMLTSLRARPLSGVNLAPTCGIAAVPSSDIPDRKAFLVMAEACLRRAQAGAGDGGLCATWQ